jgi:hypothetical protein
MTHADELRAALRRDLVAAMKARDQEAVAALRTAMGAIDNREAVSAPAAPAPVTSEHIAGAAAGVGSTEAARRALDADDVRAALRELHAEHLREAERYEQLGEADAATRLRRRADVIAPHAA